MAFPDLKSSPIGHPGAYERQMGRTIYALLGLFRGRVPDLESHGCVLELAETPERWSAGHRVFDEVRRRLLQAETAQDAIRMAQYGFEEACAQAMYNATEPQDPFDPGAPFFVAGQAVLFARVAGVPATDVLNVLAGTRDAAQQPAGADRASRGR